MQATYTQKIKFQRRVKRDGGVITIRGCLILKHFENIPHPRIYILNKFWKHSLLTHLYKNPIYKVHISTHTSRNKGYLVNCKFKFSQWVKIFYACMKIRVFTRKIINTLDYTDNCHIVSLIPVMNVVFITITSSLKKYNRTERRLLWSILNENTISFKQFFISGWWVERVDRMERVQCDVWKWEGDSHPPL